MIPIAVDDADPISFTVTSSNPKIMARVRTGNYQYKVQVHSDDTGATQGQPTPLDGTMEFQMYRDLTPETADFIAGFAQSGYYDDVTFHRVVSNFMIQGGDPAGTGSGSSPFTYSNEFRPELIFTGRGQLAMANAGYQQAYNSGNSSYLSGHYTATNGSQFFVTLGQPRYLDFKHTIFGQLVRGYSTFDEIAAVKVKAQKDTDPNSEVSKPVTAVKMTSHEVTASKTDAILLLSATTTGTATITVTAKNPNGGTATKQYTVTSVVDDTNDPPMLMPIDPVVAPLGYLPNFRIQAFDLEHDAISTRFPVYDISHQSLIYAGVNGRNLSVVAPTDAGPWDLTIGVTGINDPLADRGPGDPYDPSRLEVVEIGLGDKAIETSALTLEATAGTDTGSQVLATFHQAGLTPMPGEFTATVNWGDGSSLQDSKGDTPAISIVRSANQAGWFEVRGSHNYERVGRYPLQVTIDGSLGATDTARGATVVSADTAVLRAVGEEFSFHGGTVTGRPLAYFRDSTAGAKLQDYSTIIDWGDGNRTPGMVRKVAEGRFAVFGTHHYVDPESYSVVTHINRSGPGAATIAWGRVQLSGFEGPEHLPPFSKASITSLWSGAPQKTYRAPGATDLTGTLFIVNGGDKPTKKWKLRFWLSNNATLEKNTDKIIKVGPLNKLLDEISLNSLAPGAGGNLGLTTFKGGDLTMRLPAGETGAGKYVLAELEYSDPITDKMPVPKVIPFGPLTGIIVNLKPTDTSLFQLAEDPAGKALTTSFAVRLDTAPTGDVTIPLDIAINGTANTTRATLSTDHLTFNSTNWKTAQTVTITVIDDNIKNSSSTVTVRLKPATSSDWRFNNMDAADLTLPIVDNPHNVVVNASALSVDEGTTKTFKIHLQSKPTSDVTVPLQIVDANGNPDTSRATLDKASLTFSSTNYSTDQTVTVTGLSNSVINGDANFTIRVNPATSSDTGYNGRNGADIALTVKDVLPAVEVSTTSITVAANASAKSFTVRLKTLPTAEVHIPLDLVDGNGDPDTTDASLSTAELVFTPQNGTTAQTVTVTPLNAGTGQFTIRLKPAISADSNTADYHNMDPADVTLTITAAP